MRHALLPIIVLALLIAGCKKEATTDQKTKIQDIYDTEYKIAYEKEGADRDLGFEKARQHRESLTKAIESGEMTNEQLDTICRRTAGELEEALRVKENAKRNAIAQKNQQAIDAAFAALNAAQEEYAQIRKGFTPGDDPEEIIAANRKVTKARADLDNALRVGSEPTLPK